MAFCLYDTAAVDQSSTVEDLCGYGAEDADPTFASAKGTSNPKGGSQLSVDLVNAADRYSMDFANANAFGEGEGEGAAMASATRTFRGQVMDPGTSPFDSAINARLPIALSHAAAASTDGWKVGVVLYTRLGTRLELIDDLNSYSIAQFGSLDTGRDATVDYGDVIPGESVLEEDIKTGTYRSNHPVDITISATNFATGGTSVDFATGAPTTGENKFGLNCTHGGSAGNWLSNTSQDFMIGEVASNTQASVEDARPLPTHDCELEVGQGVEIGSYSNAVTIGIGSSSQGMSSSINTTINVMVVFIFLPKAVHFFAKGQHP